MATLIVRVSESSPQGVGSHCAKAQSQNFTMRSSCRLRSTEIVGTYLNQAFLCGVWIA
jgi:hypothetical protein